MHNNGINQVDSRFHGYALLPNRCTYSSFSDWSSLHGLGIDGFPEAFVHGEVMTLRNFAILSNFFLTIGIFTEKTLVCITFVNIQRAPTKIIFCIFFMIVGI